jgi:hypothetical protein
VRVNPISFRYRIPSGKPPPHPDPLPEGEGAFRTLTLNLSQREREGVQNRPSRDSKWVGLPRLSPPRDTQSAIHAIISSTDTVGCPSFW